MEHNLSDVCVCVCVCVCVHMYARMRVRHHVCARFAWRITKDGVSTMQRVPMTQTTLTTKTYLSFLPPDAFGLASFSAGGADLAPEDGFFSCVMTKQARGRVGDQLSMHRDTFAIDITRMHTPRHT